MKIAKFNIIPCYALYLVVLAVTSSAEPLKDGGLRIGWAEVDITPVGPVMLRGQYYERKSRFVQSPLIATAVAIETLDPDGSKEQAVMVSIDTAVVRAGFQEALRNAVKTQIPDFDTSKLILSATHVHSAPFLDTSKHLQVASKTGAPLSPAAEANVKLSEYGQTVIEKMGKAVVAAWKNRKPAGISRAIGYAVVGHNRRIQYANGTTEMYGSTSRDDFIGLEGPTNPGVDMLFCWDLEKKLTGIIMNVSCPAQVMEAKYSVSGDYWSEVRRQVRASISPDIHFLTQIGAAGDIAPHERPHGDRAGEPNMWDVPGIVEIGKRLARVVGDAYPDAREAIQTQVVFKHAAKMLDIPTRRVSRGEYEEALRMVAEIKSREPSDVNSPQTAWNRFLAEVRENEAIREHGPWDNKTSDYGWLRAKEQVVSQYEEQETRPMYRMELHVLRLGDVAFATNPFELFVNYGLQIIGRSKARQTFVVELACDHGGYLPTETALQRGGYSAMGNIIGPTGGAVLVEETVKLIDTLWE